MSAGCIALLAGQLCFSGSTITCSDRPVPGMISCRTQAQALEFQMQACKQAGHMSADGSTSSCVVVLPQSGTWEGH
jgi:hypothetical protein